MISHSIGFQRQFFEQLQIDKSAFANPPSNYKSSEEQYGFVALQRPFTKTINLPFINQSPCSFSEIVGHTDIIRRLSEILASQSIPRVLIFDGRRGVGKTSVARIFAQKAACEYFKLHSCFFANCKNCAHQGAAFFRDTDCARYDEAFIKKIFKSHSYEGLLNTARPVVFLDEFNYKKTEPLSYFLPRIVEDARDLVLIIAINENVDLISDGLRARATSFNFDNLSEVEITAWLYQYALSNNIPISLFNAFTIVMCSQPRSIPREMLKNLQQLRGIKQCFYDNRLSTDFDLTEKRLAKLQELFQVREEKIEKELLTWEMKIN